MLKRIVEQVSDYGRYGDRRVTALLRRKGWTVNHKRVERFWRQEGPSLPQAAETAVTGACRRIVRAIEPTYEDHVWSGDIADRTSDERPLVHRLLGVWTTNTIGRTAHWGTYSRL